MSRWCEGVGHVAWLWLTLPELLWWLVPFGWAAVAIGVWYLLVRSVEMFRRRR